MYCFCKSCTSTVRNNNNNYYNSTRLCNIARTILTKARYTKESSIKVQRKNAKKD